MNVSLWYYRKTRRKLVNEDSSDEDISNEKSSINSNHRYSSIHDKVISEYGPSDNALMSRTKKGYTQVRVSTTKKKALEVEDSKEDDDERPESLQVRNTNKSLKDEPAYDEGYNSDDPLDDESDRILNSSRKNSKIRILYHFIVASEIVIFLCF